MTRPEPYWQSFLGVLCLAITVGCLWVAMWLVAS
jgi:hypothetical protein